MKLKIKSKLILGLASLFIVIVLMELVSLYSINRLADESKAILKANYESLMFSREMLMALDGINQGDSGSWLKFEQSLQSQEKNITEKGELETTKSIKEKFVLLKASDKEKILSIRNDLYHILELNMNAIVRKNDEAQHTADKSKIYLAIIGAFSFMASFILLLNFPGYIANPIKELNEGIKAISNKNYSQRISLKKGDEFSELAESFNLMAERLDDFENSNLAKILFEKKRIETIINNMSDPIVGLDEQHNILFVNTSALRIFELSENELIGKPAAEAAKKNDLLHTLLNSNPTLLPLKIYDNNKECYFTKEIWQIQNEDKSIGEVILLKNITQYKELDLAKTNFIATVSHELKTPLASIKVSLKLLNDDRIGVLNEEQHKLVDHIKDDTQRLLKITAELLDLTQVESGNIQLQKEKVDPKSIVQYAFNALKVQAEQKKINMSVSFDENLPSVSCDMEKTAWVLVNFLSNAIRYTPENGTIQIYTIYKDNEVVFSVKDSGKGIDQKHKDRIFEKFYQVPNTETGKTGTGLGLAISKEFITAQGGKIWMESSPDEGCTFSFSLTS